jgi:hypothetical protein
MTDLLLSLFLKIKMHVHEILLRMVALVELKPRSDIFAQRVPLLSGDPPLAGLVSKRKTKIAGGYTGLPTVG